MNNIVVIAGVIITVVTLIPVLIQLIRNHPKGLMVLFFAEMWERFSYYGMRGLLVFYLTQHFLFDDAFSNNQYGSYTSLVYLVPLLGGVLADRYLGTRKSVLFGAVLLTIGQLAMAWTAPPATQTLTYQGHQYDFQIKGRIAERQVRLMVGGKPYEFGQAKDGGLEIKGLPAGAALPAELPKGSFQTETKRSQSGVNLFYLALSLIIMGVGFLKPNISTIVGQLYPPGDQRRDAGFTLYYYGINLGAFWAAVLCGLLGQEVGWGWGFGLAGGGMALGWLVFMFGKRSLQGKGEPPDPQKLARPFIGPLNREWLIYILGAAGTAGVFFFVQHNTWVGAALSGAVILSLVAVLLIIIFMCKTWVERQRMILAVVLIVGATVFFTLFEQAGTSLSLFADRNVDLSILSSPIVWDLGGLKLLLASQPQVDQLARMGADLSQMRWIDMGVSAPQTQSFNAGYILIFAPIFAAMWAYLGKRKMDPDPMLKFGIGLLQIGLGFMVVVWGAGMADSNYRMPMMLLGALYLLHTTGELCLSPVGIAQITKLSIPQVVSFMMAVWFLSSSIAQLIGARIAAHGGAETVGGQVMDSHAALLSSLGIFEKLGWAGMAAGVVFIVLSPLIGKWTHGADEGEPHVPPPVDAERQALASGEP